MGFHHQCWFHSSGHVPSGLPWFDVWLTVTRGKGPGIAGGCIDLILQCCIPRDVFVLVVVVGVFYDTHLEEVGSLRLPQSLGGLWIILGLPHFVMLFFSTPFSTIFIRLEVVYFLLQLIQQWIMDC